MDMVTKQEFIDQLSSLESVSVYNDYRMGEFIGFDLAGFSDYSGTDLERGNFAYLKDNYGEIIGEWHGGHGTVIAGFYVNDLPDVIGEEYLNLLEEYQGLQNYPSFDDEYTSEAGSELIEKAWENWGESDLRNAIKKHFQSMDNKGFDPTLQFVGDSNGIDDIIGDSDRLWQRLSKVENSVNHYPIIESGGLVYWDFDRLVPVLFEEIVQEVKEEIVQDWETVTSQKFNNRIWMALYRAGIGERKIETLMDVDKLALFNRAVTAVGAMIDLDNGDGLWASEIDAIADYAADVIKLKTWGK